MKSRIMDIIEKIFSIKSIITLVLTGLLAYMIINPSASVSKEILALYCTSYGSIMTYFFTKGDKSKGDK